PIRPGSLSPQVPPALDAAVMRALEKEPGARFQSADAFIAALDAAIKEAPPGDATAPFAPLPPPVVEPAAAEEPLDDEEEAERRRRRRWIWAAVAAAVLIGVLAGLALTRDTTTPVPNVEGTQLSVAVRLLEQDGFSVGEIKRVSGDAPRNEVITQDPLPSPPTEEAPLDCAFLSFFCSKPEVTLTVSAGPGTAKVPSTAGLPRAEAVA